MARKLNQYVTVSDPDTGQSATFGPGDDVPEWAEQRITVEGVWEGDDQPAAEPGDPGNSGTADPSAFEETEPGAESDSVESRRGRRAREG